MMLPVRDPVLRCVFWAAKTFYSQLPACVGEKNVMELILVFGIQHPWGES